ncbi:MAG: protein kinase, partial [Myxococcales bacterium]|nr:protein kinase [Myxococcales bacterium]
MLTATDPPREAHVDHPPPVPLRIAVVVGDDARADAARITSVVGRANAQLGWRYDVRFVLGDGGPPRPDPLTGGREPSWQNPLDWRDADIVIVVLWNTRPRALMAVGPMEVALWGPTDPDLLVLARKGAALVETPQEAYEKAATLEFCQAAGDRAYPYDDALSLETGLFAGLARVARDRWAQREGIDRLFCPVCGAESPVATAPAVCVEHNQVLLHMRHRQEGMGHDNLLGLALDGGRLPLHGRIGGGSFGAVYYSKMQPDGQAVAVKVLRRAGRQIEVKRFEREVKLLEQLRHPNVVEIIDHGWERDGPMYAVMEYLPGRTLNDVLHRIDARALVELMVPLLDGLGVLHQKGMVHRDLKPANIMLVDDPLRPDHPPRPVLIDLGLGKNLSNVDGSELTQHGMAMGTHNYMAPEQFERAHDVDARADLYSLSVILYRGLTGEPPFDFRGLDPVQQVEAWTEKWRELCTQPPPTIDRPDLPQPLIDLVMHGLQKKPEDRFQTAGDMRAQLLTALNMWRGMRMEPRTPVQVHAAEETTSRPNPPPAQAVAHPAAPRRPGVGWWPLLGAGTVLVVGLLALLWANRRRAEPGPADAAVIAVTPDPPAMPVSTVRAVPSSQAAHPAVLDAAVVDAATPDAVVPDAVVPDAAIPDAAIPDARPARVPASVAVAPPSAP